MAKYVRITENLFLAIKTLIDAGATYAEVRKYYGISTHTCTNIKNAENFEEYKNIIAAIAAKNAELKKKAEKKPVTPPPVEEPVTPEPVAHVVEHKQTVTIQATHYMMEEMRKTNELLALISNKLAYIVEQLQ